MTTVWYFPAYWEHPAFDPANPLLILLTGPVEWDDLVTFGLLYSSEWRELQLQSFLINLDKQEDWYNTHCERAPLLIPKWWDGSPQAFIEEIVEDINLCRRNWFPDPMSLADQEGLVWEILLNTWAIRNDRIDRIEV